MVYFETIGGHPSQTVTYPSRSLVLVTIRVNRQDARVPSPTIPSRRS